MHVDMQIGINACTHAEVCTYTHRHKGAYIGAKYLFSLVSVWHTDSVKDQLTEYYLF